MILLTRLLMLLVVVVLLVFSISNLEPVTVNLVGWQSPELPLFLVLLFVFFFGFFLALVWQALRSVGQKQDAAPASLRPAAPEAEIVPEKMKRSRRWSIGKGKQKNPEANSKAGEKDEKKLGDMVDSDAEKSNIADEPTDVPAIEDKK